MWLCEVIGPSLSEIDLIVIVFCEKLNAKSEKRNHSLLLFAVCDYGLSSLLLSFRD